jgi:hypothetical protein
MSMNINKAQYRRRSLAASLLLLLLWAAIAAGALSVAGCDCKYADDLQDGCDIPI